MKNNTLIFFSSILIFIFSVNLIKSDSNYLTHLEGSTFLVTNTTKIIEYRCTYGGQPISIWGAKINEEIDSIVKISPLYVKNGFTASNLEVDEKIKSPRKDVGKLHFKVMNPANAGLYFELSRNESFYVDTVLFSTKKSEFSQKIVNNYEIYTDNSQFGGPVPHKEYDFTASTGLFVYEYTNKILSYNFVWDQNTTWSNYFSKNEQDIYVNVSPRLVENDFYEGYGFWVCGGEKDSNIDGKIKEQFKDKMTYFEIEEEYNLTLKKKMQLLFEEQSNLYNLRNNRNNNKK